MSAGETCWYRACRSQGDEQKMANLGYYSTWYCLLAFRKDTGVRPNFSQASVIEL